MLSSNLNFIEKFLIGIEFLQIKDYTIIVEIKIKRGFIMKKKIPYGKSDLKR